MLRVTNILKRTGKFLLKFILVLIILVNLFILVTGNFYIYRAIWYTFFHGQGGPGIFDKEYFYSRQVTAAKAQPWPQARDYNKKDLPKDKAALIDDLHTTSFLVFRNDSLVYEKYYEDFGEKEVSNSFSMAKSLVSMLIGVALHEGKITSIDDPVSKYLPEYKEGNRKKITLRHLLNMSSGIEWNESSWNPLSDNAEAYYSTNLDGVMDGVDYDGKPGKFFDYKSGSTQVLAIVLKKVTGKSLAEYASEKIWKKTGAEQAAFWSLDHQDGTEKAYCCLYATSRDFARLGKLMMHWGNWNGEQILDSAYVAQSITPAELNIPSPECVPNDRYGLTWWLVKHNDHQVFYARGIKGQYIICMPDENLMVVRTGHKRGKKLEGDIPAEVMDYIDAGLYFKTGTKNYAKGY